MEGVYYFLINKKIEVFCDESSLENIFKDKKEGFMVIGGIWIEKKDHKKVKKEINNLKKKHNLLGEFKWNKVSPSRQEFYFELLDYFFGNRKIRFRCIVVDSSKVDLKTYHDSDAELGFYKLYFQLLTHWCNDLGTYYLYLDDKSNSDQGRLPKLKEILNIVSLGEIRDVLPTKSEQSIFIQLADVLTGAVSHHFNSKRVIGESSKIKNEFIDRIEEHIGCQLKGTDSSERKFNIFKIRLRDNV